VRLGVHISIKNGFTGAGRAALELGCDGWQMFVGNPRGWGRSPIAPTDVESFLAFRKRTKMGPVVVHAAYLPNPATEDPELAAKSRVTVLEDFHRANLLGADFFVLHPGKAKDAKGQIRAAQMLNPILAEVDGPTRLLLENQAGMGSEIVAKFEDLAELLALIKEQKRVGVCFDTCHAFAAGYDLSTPTGWESTLRVIERSVGIDAVKLLHLNDSLGAVGSRLDRHQHIGEGRIGRAGFEYLVNHPKLRKLPGILETPQQAADDDHRNLATLRSLIREG
jgi:deoxyribonuclease-4